MLKLVVEHGGGVKSCKSVSFLRYVYGTHSLRVTISSVIIVFTLLEIYVGEDVVITIDVDFIAIKLKYAISKGKMNA